MIFDFTDKTILVTGGSRGIGAAIVNLFEQHGGKVISIGSKDYDLGSNIGLTALMAYVGALDKIDVLINNAGIIHTETIDNISFEQYDSLMNINLKAPFFLTKAVSKLMQKNNYGRIVNIASIAANRVRSGRAAYSASKSALITMSKVVSIELAPYNVLVNTVSPGFTFTEMFEKNVPEDLKQKLLAKIPLGKFASVDDIASTVLYLSSDNNTHLTGQDIVVDGGFLSAISG
ncbi:MAG: SDR family oxidoreductase [Bacteroidota bacterium]